MDSRNPVSFAKNIIFSGLVNLENKNTTAIILTLLAAFFWGSNFQAAKIALATIPPWTASMERFIIAVIGTFILLHIKEKICWKVLSRNIVAFIILGIIGIAGFNGALFVGLQTSSPITAALIMATTPVSANLLEAFIHRQMPTKDRIIGMIISLSGVSLVITNGQILSGNIDFAQGDIIILAGSLGWAAYTVGTKAYISDSIPLETTAWTMLFGTIALSVAAFFIETPGETMAIGSASGFLAILWMGIAGSVLAYLFWNVGIMVRGAGKTSIFFNFVPIFALLIELAMGTPPHAMQIIGIAITIFGVLTGQGRLPGLKKNLAK